MLTSSSSSSSPSLYAASPRHSATSYRSARSLAGTSIASSASPIASNATAVTSPTSSRKRASQSPITSPATRPRAAITANFSTATQQSPRISSFVDAGTQYSPTDWPPTSSRSSKRSGSAVALAAVTGASNPPDITSNSLASYRSADSRLQEPPQPTQKVASQVTDTDGDDGLVPPNAPAEPDLRVTPTEALNNAIRRPLSAESSTDTSGTSNTSAESQKRPRHGTATPSGRQVLPADYSKCPAKTLASIIATLLMRLIAHNDNIPLKDGQLTRFHSRAPPGISVHDYLARLTFHGTLSPPILLSMVFFIDRLSSNYPKFIINSLTVHRFLITAATAASKGLSDSFWTNHVYARVGGVTVKELALLELELLIQCDWKIVPKQEDLVEYYRGLVRQSEEYVLEGEENVAGSSSARPSRGATPSRATMATSPRHTLDLAKLNNHSAKGNEDEEMDTSGEHG